MRDPLLFKASRAMPQMVFPNGYIANIGDSSYHRIWTDQLELMAAYAKAKGDDQLLHQCAAIIHQVGKRELRDDIAFFFYLDELPEAAAPELSRVSYAPCYPAILGRNPSKTGDVVDALAFSLCGFSEKMGHRHPNGISLELCGRGEVFAPDIGAGGDYWCRETHEYYRHVAGHNTVAVNGLGLDDRRQMLIDVKAADPMPVAGEGVFKAKSPYRQFVDVESVYDAGAVKARQRRTVAIVRSGVKAGYFVDIFRSKVVEGEEKYHDYIYHNLGEWEMGNGERIPRAKRAPKAAQCGVGTGNGVLYPGSGKGYDYFKTLGVLKNVATWKGDVDYDGDMKTSIHVAMSKPADELYVLEGPKAFRHYKRSVAEKPCPALLVRKRGEAWREPFVAVYEPHGRGVNALIYRVETCPLKSDAGGVCVKVIYKDASRYDEIVHSPENGFSVTSFKNGRPVDVYKPQRRGGLKDTEQ